MSVKLGEDFEPWFTEISNKRASELARKYEEYMARRRRINWQLIIALLIIGAFWTLFAYQLTGGLR